MCVLHSDVLSKLILVSLVRAANRAGGNGGCCDCGDAEAWNSNGACPRHKDTTELNDPLSVVPPELQQGLQIVAKAAIEFMVNHLVQTVCGYHDWDSNVHVREHLQTGTRVAVQLHNDDIHTYDDVTTALRDMGLSGAAPLTRAVKGFIAVLVFACLLLLSRCCFDLCSRVDAMRCMTGGQRRPSVASRD